MPCCHGTLPSAPSEKASVTHLSQPWTLSLIQFALGMCLALNIKKDKTGVTMYRLGLSSGSSGLVQWLHNILGEMAQREEAHLSAGA